MNIGGQGHVSDFQTNMKLLPKLYGVMCNFFMGYSPSNFLVHVVCEELITTAAFFLLMGGMFYLVLNLFFYRSIGFLTSWQDGCSSKAAVTYNLAYANNFLVHLLDSVTPYSANSFGFTSPIQK